MSDVPSTLALPIPLTALQVTARGRRRSTAPPAEPTRERSITVSAHAYAVAGARAQRHGIGLGALVEALLAGLPLPAPVERGARRDASLIQELLRTRRLYQQALRMAETLAVHDSRVAARTALAALVEGHHQTLRAIDALLTQCLGLDHP